MSAEAAEKAEEGRQLTKLAEAERAEEECLLPDRAEATMDAENMGESVDEECLGMGVAEHVEKAEEEGQLLELAEATAAASCGRCC